MSTVQNAPIEKPGGGLQAGTMPALRYEFPHQITSTQTSIDDTLKHSMEVPDIEFPPPEKLSRRAKLCFIGAFLTLLVGFVLYIFFHDDKLMDDSDLAITFREIPDAENGLHYLTKFRDTKLDFDDGYEKIRAMFGFEQEPLEWDPVHARESLERYADLIEAIQQASSANYIKLTPENNHFGRASYTLGDAALLFNAKARTAVDNQQISSALDDVKTLLDLANLVNADAENDYDSFIATCQMGAAIDIIAYISATETDIPREQFLNTIRMMVTTAAAYQQSQRSVLFGQYQKQKQDFLNFTDTRWGKGEYLHYRPRKTVNQIMQWFRVEKGNIGKPHCDIKRSIYIPPTNKITLYFNYVGEDNLRAEISNIGVAYVSNYYLAEFEMAMTIAALRLYYQENKQLPDSLTQLAPTYLTKIPTDRYNGQALHYDKKRAKIWCVGRNLADDGSPPSDDTAHRGSLLDPMMQIKWLAE
jgi:hypothetical protein